MVISSVIEKVLQVKTFNTQKTLAICQCIHIEIAILYVISNSALDIKVFCFHPSHLNLCVQLAHITLDILLPIRNNYFSIVFH